MPLIHGDFLFWKKKNRRGSSFSHFREMGQGEEVSREQTEIKVDSLLAPLLAPPPP